MFGRRRRQEQRIRERGQPASATVVDARPAGEGRWDLRLHVTPEADPPFEAEATASLPAGGTPAVGSRVDVLHDPGNRSRVVLAGVPPTVEAPGGAAWGTGAPTVEVTGAGAGDPPDPMDVIRQAFAGLADGSTLGADWAGEGTVVNAGTTIHVDGERVDADPSPGAERLDMDDLRRMAQTDPGGMAHEIMRRLASGEISPRKIQVDTRSVDLDGAQGADALRALADSGLLTPEQLEKVRRHLGG